MASPTWWAGVWVSSRCQWWTGKPGLLQSMGSHESDMPERLDRFNNLLKCICSRAFPCLIPNSLHSQCRVPGFNLYPDCKIPYATIKSLHTLTIRSHELQLKPSVANQILYFKEKMVEESVGRSSYSPQIHQKYICWWNSAYWIPSLH